MPCIATVNTKVLAYTRLDWTSLDWKLQKWNETRLPDVLRDAVRCTDWKCCRCFDFSSAHHVNIQEARAMLAASDCHAAHQSGPVRSLNVTDSRVVFGRLGKGSVFLEPPEPHLSEGSGALCSPPAGLGPVLGGNSIEPR